MNINVEMLVGSQRCNKLSCSSRRRRIIIGKAKTRVRFRMTDRARRTGRTITSSSRKTIVPTSARNTRWEETGTSGMRTDILLVSFCDSYKWSDSVQDQSDHQTQVAYQA